MNNILEFGTEYFTKKANRLSAY